MIYFSNTVFKHTCAYIIIDRLSLARSEYIGVIGEPAIISYDVRFDYALGPTLYASGYYAIHIPHLNPGFPAHKGGGY